MRWPATPSRPARSAPCPGGGVGGELRLLAAEPTALGGLTRARAIGLDRALHPSFEPRLDLAERALNAGVEARRDLLVLARLLHALRAR